MAKQVKKQGADSRAEYVVFEGIRVKMTPMMEQFIAAKTAQAGAVLFFRMGDFYELFFDDARLVHRELGLTLTSRNKGEADEVPMAGVPFRAAEEYIASLVERGHRVAVCDQLEDPSKATGIVQRGITRVVTPGTWSDERPGEERKPRLLAAAAAVSRRGGGIEEEFGLAVIDVANGAFRVTEALGVASLVAELQRLGVHELVVAAHHEGYIRPAVQRLGRATMHIRAVDGELFEPKAVLRAMTDGPAPLGDWREPAIFLGRDAIRATFDAVEEFGFRRPRGALAATAAIVAYLSEVQRGVAGHVDTIVPYRLDDYMVLDEATQANLELTETLRGAKREGSLLGVLDETVTAPGARRLRTWITYPLLDRQKIEARLDAVGELVNSYSVREQVRELLDRTHDIERLTGKLASGRATPRDLVNLKTTLATVPELHASLQAVDASLLRRHRDELDACQDVTELIARALVDQPPMTLQEGGAIREGYSEDLDHVVELARSGKDWLLRFEQSQRAATGISSLKVKYSRVFGYFIEITRSNLHLVPEEFIRRQTLANAERFYTPELKEYEEEVLTAEERRQTLELEIFEAVRAQVAAEVGRLRHTASLMANLDVMSALAHVAHQRDYCRPELCDELVLEIAGGRHPVVERFLTDERFVPNDLVMDGPQSRVQIITGPNMAGKSTVIRQAALITLLAQAGAFVPAVQAKIGLVDRIFSRVGASDNLAQGQSTFMVEMTEAAHILHHATARSLIILDEIGRGTATYDGLSIAWAVAEHLHDTVGARVLFATHYHELTELSRLCEGVVNYSVAVKEWQQDIIFLRKLVAGPANRSYGIQVARLAGVPAPVIERAKEILYNLEMNSYDDRGRPSFAHHLSEDEPAQPGASDGQREAKAADQQPQLALFGGAASRSSGDKRAGAEGEDKLADELSQLSLDTTTPLQALNLLYKWQRRLKRR